MPESLKISDMGILHHYQREVLYEIKVAAADRPVGKPAEAAFSQGAVACFKGLAKRPPSQTSWLRYPWLQGWRLANARRVLVTRVTSPC